MRMRGGMLFVLVCCFMFAMLPGQAVAAAPAKDTDGFYQITTSDDLVWLSEEVNDGAFANDPVNARLMNDIDMAGVEWTPIGYGADWYYGTFDGQLYAISNLTITAPALDLYDITLGLFGGVYDSEIRNIRMKNVNFDVEIDIDDFALTYIGAIAGVADNALIEHCRVDGGTIAFSDSSAYSRSVFAGGVAGTSESGTIIQNCVVSGLELNLTAANAAHENYAGGVVGLMNFWGGLQVTRNCLVEDSSIVVGGSASGHWTTVGGIVGSLVEGRISRIGIAAASEGVFVENCAVIDNVLTANAANGSTIVGGVAGRTQYGNIYNCTVDGAASSISRNGTVDSYAGGIVGFYSGALPGTGDNFFRRAMMYNARWGAADSMTYAIGNYSLGYQDTAWWAQGMSYDTSRQNLPAATILLDDVMKVVDRGDSLPLERVTYPGDLQGGVVYGWDKDDSFVSLSAATGALIDVTGVSAGIDYVECTPSPTTITFTDNISYWSSGEQRTLTLRVEDLRCSFRVDGADDPEPEPDDCEGDCGGGCSALPFAGLAMLLLPGAAWLVKTGRKRA